MIDKIKKIITSKEFQKFVVVGGLSFVLDFGILNFQIYILNFNPTLLGFIVVPNLISTSIAIIFNFLAQKYWTFKSEDTGSAAKQGGKFLLVHVSNLLIFNTLLFGLLVQFGIIIPITKILVTGIQMGYSYMLYKYFVFKSNAVPPDTLIE